MECPFCLISNGTQSATVVYEDQDHIAFLDIYPQDTGHTLVIPKIHYPGLFDLSESAYTALWLFVKRVEKKLRSVSKAERVYVKVIGTDVPHVHVHLIPSSFEGVSNKMDLVAVGKKVLLYSEGT